MTPDPTREWYVYFQEQEMGPFSEKELQRKISIGELDDSAFVFTEGLSDWTAVDDLEFLAPASPVEAPATLSESAEADDSSFDSDEDSDSSEGLQESQTPEVFSQTVTSRSLNVEKLGAEEESELEKRLTKTEIQPAGHKMRILLKWGMLGFVLLLVVGVGVDYLNMAPSMKSPLMTNLFGDSKAQKTPPAVVDATPKVTPVEQSTDQMWTELNQLRAVPDRQGPPFRISSVLLSPDRPIIVGAVSALVDSLRVHLVVYPDLSRSLMSDPMIWWFDPALVDGYFAVGPLNVNGKPLPPGTYKVMVQGMGKFFGLVSFDVGTYPSGPDLDVQLKGLQNQRALAASDEQKVLERLFSEFDSIYETLRVDAVRYAIKGATRRTAWTKSMSAWSDAFAKISAELTQMRGLTYFKNLQDKMEAFSKEMLKVQGLMDLYSKSGRAAFEKRAGRRYSETWNAIQKDRDFLKSDVLALSSQTQFEPVIDEELLKARLLERK